MFDRDTARALVETTAIAGIPEPEYGGWRLRTLELCNYLVQALNALDAADRAAAEASAREAAYVAALPDGELVVHGPLGRQLMAHVTVAELRAALGMEGGST
jgi:hypothetical protein